MRTPQPATRVSRALRTLRARRARETPVAGWGVRKECTQKKGTKKQPKVFLTEVFGNPLGSWTSAPSGHGCPRQNACFSRILTALTEVLGRDIRANDPRMSAGCPSQKLPLWADFSFLKNKERKGPRSTAAGLGMQGH